MNLKNLVQTCGACPSQWEALTIEDDRDVYIRYRYGQLTIWVGEPGIVNGAFEDNALLVLSRTLGDEFDGVISYEEIEPIILNLDLTTAISDPICTREQQISDLRSLFENLNILKPQNEES